MVNNVVTIEKQIRQDTPQVSVAPYKQIHAHSTGNPSSTAQNEADYMSRKELESGYFTHVVGNGQVIQTANVNRGAWDVGGKWNNETYAAVELIESHKTKVEFDRDYKLYVQLLRELASQGGIPIKVDCGIEGINTHYYCTYNQPGNKSDHIDPYPYLKKWGISKEQFKKDIENGFPSSGNISEAPGTSGQKNKKVGSVMLLFKDSDGKIYWLVGNKYVYVGKPADLDKIKVMMKQAGYDTWEHTNQTQISYIKRVAELVK